MSQELPFIPFRKFLISEAISNANSKRAGILIQKYLTKKLGKEIYIMPGIEEFMNSDLPRGFGVRFFIGNTGKSLRLNWVSANTDSSELHSVSIWNGKGRAPDLTVSFDRKMSLVKTLPMIVDILKNPKTGNFTYLTSDALNEDWELEEEMLTEASGNRDYDDAVALLIPGEIVVTQGAKAKVYNIVKAIRAEYPEMFEKLGRQFVFTGSPEYFRKNSSEVLDRIGMVKVTVKKGPSKEEYKPSKQIEQIEQDQERISFEMQLEDLYNLVQATALGATNACFVAGKGGVGKTHTVEKALNDLGKTDGNGYFKITGSSSPIGMYMTLFKNRNGIVLFDDSDSALDSQEGRNLIKAATDTKKVRKMVWMKKSSMIVDPDSIDEDDEESDKIPSYYEFTGRVIFISNLKIDKLDPDGALRTRGFMVNIDPTDMEIVDFMKKICHTVELEDGLQLSQADREDVIEMIRENPRNLSLRKMVRALNIRATMPDRNTAKRYIQLYA